MELKFVIPNMEKTFGNLEFAGEDKVVQRRINGRLLFKEYHYKIQEVDHQSKPPPLRKSVRNHEVENFSDWWFWIILDGLLTASVCCHFIFR